MSFDTHDFSDLDSYGAARLPGLLSPAQCRDIIRCWETPERFRNEVVMEHKGYGSGTYRYFDYPLPETLADLRASLYPALAAIANRWAEQMGGDPSFPADHQSYLDHCHAQGQAKATPLILRYGAGDWNALHQDIYGDCVFPLQLVILLSEPGTDFTGGEFVLSEQRPRMQSRPEVVQLAQGDGVVFATRERPAASKRGFRRVQMRHGVSRIRSGERWTLGIIFHDAG